MKKNLFMMAAAALALAACTSDDLSINDEKQVAQVGNVPVAFDTYISSNTNGTTRAGETPVTYKGYGAFTTDNLRYGTDKIGGFGVFASYYPEEKYEFAKSSAEYNFMYNQWVKFKSEGVWEYTPLLYWPNETSKTSDDYDVTDQQTGNTAKAEHLDRVSFFAYAPYVVLDEDATAGIDPTDGKVYVSSETKAYGSVLFPKVDGKGEPVIKYVMGKKPETSEDLLWAVAPYGGLKYTAVNGDQVDIAYGTSFIDLVKPAVNTKIKFLFQHALTALKMSIQAAVDVVEPKEAQKLDENTKIYVNSIVIKSNDDGGNGFATLGTLSLLNREEGKDANIPNWSSLTQTIVDGKSSLVISGLSDINDTESELANNANIQLNPELYAGVIGQGYADAADNNDWDFSNTDIPGVREKETDVFVKKDGFASDLLMFIPVLAEGYGYSTAKDLDVTVTIDYDVVTKGSNVKGGYVVVNNKISKDIKLPKYRNGRIYKLKLILGMTSVQLEAEASDWTEVGQEVDLPRNLD